MLIECLVKREGPTTVTLEKMKYLFMPIPGSKKGEQVTSVCEVSSEEHLKYFLSPRRAGNFREYDQEQSQKELEADRKKTNLFKGFSVQKYMENGYILVDMRNPKKQRFADITGNWTDKRVGLSPWSTEMEAFTWLKGEIEMGLIEPMEVEEAPNPKKGKKVDETVSKITGTAQGHVG